MQSQRSEKRDERKGRFSEKEFVWFWFLTKNVFGMSLGHFAVSRRNVQLFSACACDFGQLTLSVFPVIFIIYKMSYKGCPMVVVQYITEGSVSRDSLLTY